MESRAKRIGLLHGLSNVTVVLLFATAWWMRGGAADLAPTAGVFSIEVTALALGATAGWLGGELVDRLAVGVDDALRQHATEDNHDVAIAEAVCRGLEKPIGRRSKHAG